MCFAVKAGMVKLFQALFSAEITGVGTGVPELLRGFGSLVEDIMIKALFNF